MILEPGKLSTPQESRLLLALTRVVTATLDLQEVLDQSLAALRQLMTFDGGSIQLIIDGALQLVAADPAAPPEVYEFRLPLGEGFGGRVAATGEPIYSADATVDPRAHPEGRAKASTAGVRSYFAAPLIEGGRPIGVVQLDSATVDAFSQEAQALVLAFLPTITAAVQNARMFDREVEAIASLREAERAKRDFLAIVSHELRTPLTSVLGFAETLRTHADTLGPDDVRAFAERIVFAGRGLTRLIEDLLDLTAIERGGLPVNLVHADIARSIPDWVTMIEAPGHRIEIDIAPGLPTVVADPDRVHQILQNLITNAIKFSPVRSVVRIEAEEADDGVVVRVRDQGRGIPREAVERIFERFYQVEHPDTRSTGGLGVGLHVVKLLCDGMNATVDVQSEPGKGSVFSITFPVVASTKQT